MHKKLKVAALIFIALFAVMAISWVPYYYTLQVRSNLILADSCRIVGNAWVRGVNAFTTSATLDTVLIPGLKTTDFTFATTIKQAATVAGDQIGCFSGTDTLFVSRAAGTTSGQGFNYFILR